MVLATVATSRWASLCSRGSRDVDGRGLFDCPALRVVLHHDAEPPAKETLGDRCQEIGVFLLDPFHRECIGRRYEKRIARDGYSFGGGQPGSECLLGKRRSCLVENLEPDFGGAKLHEDTNTLRRGEVRWRGQARSGVWKSQAKNSRFPAVYSRREMMLTDHYLWPKKPRKSAPRRPADVARV